MATQTGSGKKILITTYDFAPNTGGVATYAWELADSLSRQGFQVLVLTKSRKGPMPTCSNFKVKAINLPDAGLLAFPMMVPVLRQLIREWQPEKIICTLWMPDAAAAVMARWSLLSQVEIYTIVHAKEIIESTTTWKKSLRKKLGFIKRFTFHNVTKVICVSNFTKKQVLKETGLPAEKVIVIHNGVNPAKFHATHLQPYTSDRWEKSYPVFLTISRLIAHKGIDQMIRAMPAILEVYPKAHYLIGGTGPDKGRLQQLVADHGLTTAVSFLGFVEESSLPTYYTLADLFVLLSREEPPEVEGFGLVLLEAAACGTPALGGNSGGIPDAVIDGLTGWLVDPLDHHQIAHQVIEIFKSPEIVEIMGKSAREYTLAHRQWDQVSQQIVKQMYGHG